MCLPPEDKPDHPGLVSDQTYIFVSKISERKTRQEQHVHSAVTTGHHMIISRRCGGYITKNVLIQTKSIPLQNDQDAPHVLRKDAQDVHWKNCLVKVLSAFLASLRLH